MRPVKIKKLYKNIKVFANDLKIAFVTYLPGKSGNYIRYKFYKKRLKYCGHNVQIFERTAIFYPEYVELHDNVIIGRNVTIYAHTIVSQNNTRWVSSKMQNSNVQEGCVIIHSGVALGDNTEIFGSGGVVIGKNSTIAVGGVKLYSCTHLPYDKNNRAYMTGANRVSNLDEVVMNEPIIIGENVFIGTSSIILPGVKISDNSFVRLNSVLFNAEYNENSILAGDPAKKIADRFI